jgi:hypothetical protein
VALLDVVVERARRFSAIDMRERSGERAAQAEPYNFFIV